MTLCSAGLEVLVPKRGLFPPGDMIMMSPNWKLWPLGHFWPPHASKSPGKEGSFYAGWVIDHQGEIRCYNRGQEGSIWNTGGPLGCLLVWPCLVIKVERNYNKPNPGSTTNGPDLSRVKSLIRWRITTNWSASWGQREYGVVSERQLQIPATACDQLQKWGL